MFITEFFTGSFAPIQHKAPTGKMFRIHDVHISVLTAGDNAVFIMDRPVEEGILTLDATFDASVFVVMPTDIANMNDFDFGVPVDTKYLTIIRDNSTTMIAAVTIFYDFIKVSKADLIYEWFSKNR